MLRLLTPRPSPLPFTAFRAFVQRRERGTAAATETDEEAIQAARKWLANLNADTIRQQTHHDLSFSRSSGPGGQSVNKVSSKATLRIPTSSLLPILPRLLHSHILNSRYHAAKTSDLVIQADDARKQSDNANACFQKLHNLILEAGRVAVPGETSEETSQRVLKLQKADKGRQRRAKEAQKRKKNARRGGDD